MAYKDGQETKRLIANVCLELMRHTPPESINVSDIAQAADISRQTFYYHFHSIYDILPWLISTELKDMAKDGVDMKRLNPMDTMIRLGNALRNNKDTVTAFLPAYRHRMHLDLSEYMERRMHQYLSVVLGNMIDRTSIATIARFHSAGYTGIVELWMENGMDDSLFEMANRIRNTYPELLSAELYSRIKQLQTLEG